MQGFELEGTGLVTDNFTLSANVSYNDGKYDKFEADTNGDGVNDVFLSGLPLTRTPEWKYGVQGLYTFEPWEGRFDLYGSVGLRGRERLLLLGVPIREFNSVLDERTLVDASITYTRRRRRVVRARLRQQSDRRDLSHRIAGRGRSLDALAVRRAAQLRAAVGMKFGW